MRKAEKEESQVTQPHSTTFRGTVVTKSNTELSCKLCTSNLLIYCKSINVQVLLVKPIRRSQVPPIHGALAGIKRQSILLFSK